MIRKEWADKFVTMYDEDSVGLRVYFNGRDVTSNCAVACSCAGIDDERLDGKGYVLLHKTECNGGRPIIRQVEDKPFKHLALEIHWGDVRIERDDPKPVAD